MSAYEVNAQTYSKVYVDEKDIAKIIDKKRSQLLGKWDAIIIRPDGTGYYHRYGSGSHNYGEMDGPDASSDMISAYLTLKRAENLFLGRWDPTIGEEGKR